MGKVSSKGHAEHTKAAEEVRGLRGAMRRKIKITMLGAGSGFTPRLVSDVLQIPDNQGGTIALVDIDAGRLETMTKLIGKLIAQMGLAGKWNVVGSRDRKTVLKGSHYVVNCIEVSGLACVALDNDIPLKYGLDQCIGDTIGPGGLFKALRTAPVFLEVLRDVEKLSPEAIVLNYTNPMSILCLAAGRASRVPVVGLCHSVQGTSHQLAGYAEVPYGEMDWECAGINHLAWFTKLEHKGEDLYERILYKKFAKEVAAGRKEAEAGIGVYDAADAAHDATLIKYQGSDLVRKDMCLHFGAFITESSGHLSEYLPYYRHNPEGQKLLRLAYDGGKRFYATNWPTWRANADKSRNDMLAGKEQIGWERSWEYASWIIEAREKDVPYRIHGNVMNNCGGAGELIANLPADGVVEVACMVDRSGVNPVRYGKLPAQMAGICAGNMRMFDLAATACIEKSKEAAVHALMLDPYTAAVCTPGQIRRMTEELLAAEKEFLPGYK